MNRVGTDYLIPCKLFGDNKFGVREEFKVINKKDGTSHVSFTTGTTGISFASPVIITKDGLVSVTAGNIDSVITSRQGIYALLDNILLLVDVYGDFDTDTGVWKDFTVDFYGVKDVVVTNGVANLVCFRYNAVSETITNAFRVGNGGFSANTTGTPLDLRNAIMVATTGIVRSKSDFYSARGGK